MAKSLTKIHTPDREDVLAARQAAGHTQIQAAAAVHVDARSWQRWEAGAATMSPGLWELYLLKTWIKRLP